MNLGEMLGDKQEALRAAVEKQEKKRKEAEQNRRRSRGELIRYPKRGR